jgi:hypothetical protein
MGRIAGVPKKYRIKQLQKLKFTYLCSMRSIRVDILNPKAARLLKELEELQLISIKKVSKSGFEGFLKKLRSKKDSAPSIEEITKEVEIVRSKRYGK